MLMVDFINVGYGDAILIREKKDGVSVFSALVDCGDVKTGGEYPSCRIDAVDFLKNESISHLDLLVVTHLHLDHVGGLSRIADEVKISEFAANYIPHQLLLGNTFSIPEAASEGAARLIESANIYSRVLHKLSFSGTNIHIIHKKCNFTIGNTHFQMSLADPMLYQRQQEILNKLFSSGEIYLADLDELHSFINDTSLSVRLEYADKSFELTSDKSAKQLLKSPCTIIKIPHHGHSDSMTPDLASALKADYAVISVSNDRKDNCPDAAIIKMLTDCGTKILITDSPKCHSSINFTITENGRLSCNSTGY